MLGNEWELLKKKRKLYKGWKLLLIFEKAESEEENEKNEMKDKTKKDLMTVLEV